MFQSPLLPTLKLTSRLGVTTLELHQKKVLGYPMGQDGKAL